MGATEWADFDVVEACGREAQQHFDDWAGTDGAEFQRWPPGHDCRIIRCERDFRPDGTSSPDCRQREERVTLFLTVSPFDWLFVLWLAVAAGGLPATASWRWVFLVNLPFGTAAAAGAARVLRQLSCPRRSRTRWRGGWLPSAVCVRCSL